MLSSAAMSSHGILATTASLTIRASRYRSSTPTDVRFFESLFTGIKSAGLPLWSQAFVTIENFRAARMGKDNQKTTANVAQDGAVYDDDRFVRCQPCGSWINAHNPSSLFEHRGPLPHPRIAGAEWIDDDD
jgi:hypothetical protein